MTQEQTVLHMLRSGPQSTHDFCSTPGLAAEYRRAISMLRRKGHAIVARKMRQGCWEYKLLAEA